MGGGFLCGRRIRGARDTLHVRDYEIGELAQLMAHAKGEKMSRPNALWCLLAALFVVLISKPLHAADDQVNVVPASELKLWWQVDSASPNSSPPYPVEALRDGGEGCVAVAFEIHSDGSVSNERVWHSGLTGANSIKELEQAALLTVHQWRFAPAATNASHASVYTYQTITFTLVGSDKWTGQDQQHHDELEAKCNVPDFPQQVQAMAQAAAKTNGGTQ